MICEKPIGGGKKLLILKTVNLEELNKLLANVTYTSTVYHIHTGDLGTLFSIDVLVGGCHLKIHTEQMLRFKKKILSCYCNFALKAFQYYCGLCYACQIIFRLDVFNLFCSSLLV